MGGKPDKVYGMIKEYDVPVRMRDGVTLYVDVYRPDGAGKFPVLYSCAMHNKDLQRVEVAENLKVGQPAWSTQWYGVIEAGDSKRFVANGYVHVIGQVRGAHENEGNPFEKDDWDHYDTMEWIVSQPWCDGNIGMVGLSAYGAEQWRAAAQGHPALKAIFPLDPGGAIRRAIKAGIEDLFIADSLDELAEKTGGILLA